MTASASVRTAPRILFSSPCGPYPKSRVDKDPIDFFYYRNTLGQKLFQLRSFQSWYSLHFLAQNLPVPSVVLENPTMGTFQEEVLHGDYQVVAIGFTVITMARVLKMVSWIRQARPGIEIILGGYGTAVFKDPDADAALLQAKVDAICYGEGIAFMRNYLQERWAIASTGCSDECTPRQDFLEMRHCFFRTSFPLFKQIVILGSLGCTFGCPFCATSSQFDRKRVLVASAQELFDVLLAQARKHPEVQSAIVYDEDFLIDRVRVLEFMNLMEQCSELCERPMLLTVFASVRTVKMYSISELIRCGIGTLFIGVESFQTDILEREGMKKRGGDVEELFDELHRHGINTLGSLILGWDGQSPERLREESRRFAALNPTFYQVVPLHPVPGTPLWKRLRSEHRMLQGFSFEHDSIDNFTFELRDASHDEALGVVSDTYRRLVSEGGPWPFRFTENLLRGYRTLANGKDPIYPSRAMAYRLMLGRVLPLAMVSRGYFHGKGFARRWRNTMSLSVRQFPLLSLKSALIALPLFPLLALLYGAAWLSYWLRPSGDQPPFIRQAYAGTPSVASHRKQAGEDTNSLLSLLDIKTVTSDTRSDAGRIPESASPTNRK
jgi:hypothetical protein